MNPITQKAHDISFAVYRVAALIKDDRLREELNHAGLDLISYLYIGRGKGFVYEPVEKLKALITFAVSIKEMSELNAKILLRELDNLQAAIQAVIADNDKDTGRESKINNDGKDADHSAGTLISQ